MTTEEKEKANAINLDALFFIEESKDFIKTLKEGFDIQSEVIENQKKIIERITPLGVLLEGLTEATKSIIENYKNNKKIENQQFDNLCTVQQRTENQLEIMYEEVKNYDRT